MLRKIMTRAFLITLVCFIFATTVFAEDLSIIVNRADNTLSITNSLGIDIYVISMESGGNNIPLNVKLDAGATSVFQLSAPAPTVVDNAKCVLFGPAPAGYQKGADGYYRLSVNYSVI